MSLSSEQRDKIVAQFNNISDIEQLHDDYNSFRELYDYRAVLFCYLLKNNIEHSWKSKTDFHNNDLGNWFIAGLNLPNVETISFHMSDDLWGLLSDIKEIPNAPEWDHSNSEETLKRLVKLVI